jgi:L-alanine-DL-glutamate epimerase-like enolase superfamily enzyme
MHTDVRVIDARLYFLPLKMRVPLKFGAETVDQITCVRVCVTVTNKDGVQAKGWGETPISAAWAWPGKLAYRQREDAMLRFCGSLASAWSGFDFFGHPMEIGHAFTGEVLPRLLKECNARQDSFAEPMPYLAALICCSAFDQAVHDAYGVSVGRPLYGLYDAEHMNRDLSFYLEPAAGGRVRFEGLYPKDFLVAKPATMLPAWHLVGGVDALYDGDLNGGEPDDGYPVTLVGWIKRDGLKALKVKLRGNDSRWDYQRMCRVGELALRHDVLWLSADFNCMVTDPAYVNDLLDRLKAEYPRIYGALLYVEQPFPHAMEDHPIDVHSVSSRKPLMMDESAHDWQHVRMGRELGWNGVALKTCKTQTGALLSLCWARAHGMALMVQDLTNPSLAMIPHALLASHCGTIYGVETNAVQFWPDASKPESRVHTGLYERRNGVIDLRTLTGAGFGYQIDRIGRALPDPDAGPFNPIDVCRPQEPMDSI